MSVVAGAMPRSFDTSLGVLENHGREGLVDTEDAVDIPTVSKDMHSSLPSLKYYVLIQEVCR